MAWAVFKNTLRSDWRQILYWGVGLGFFGVFMLVAIPDIEALEQYQMMLESFPPAMLEIIGVSDASIIATPEGFVNFSVFGYGILVMAVFAVLAGMSITSSEEDEGIMDVLLSLPLPRWRVVVEKLAAYILITIGIVIAVFIMLWIGLQLSAYKEIDMGGIAANTFNLLPATLLMLVATMFFSVVIRYRGMAMAAAAAFVIASYFLDFLGGAASGALPDLFQKVSLFSYYDSVAVLNDGLNFGNVALLLGVALVLAVASVWAFERRDIGL